MSEIKVKLTDEILTKLENMAFKNEVLFLYYSYKYVSYNLKKKLLEPLESHETGRQY